MQKVAKTIVIGITGSIAAHRKALGLIPQFKKEGYSVELVLTQSALKMVKLDELQQLADYVHTDLFLPHFNFEETLRTREVPHIDIAHRANLLLIVPATANTIAKLAQGIADNLLTLVVLSTRAPILFCPAMNEGMWLSPVTQENMRILEGRGYIRVGPQKGPFLSKFSPDGEGVVAEDDTIFAAAKKFLV